MDTLSRRTFFRAGTSALLASALGFDVTPAIAAARTLKFTRTTKTSSVCPYCAVGCSVVVHTLGDRADNVRPAVVHVEGDPESPINRGTLCPKGISLKEFIVNERRLTQPLVRSVRSGEWTAISWDDALARMARRIKDTRDRTFEATDSQGRTVNRLESVGLIGGCTDTNEVNYLLGKFRFGLGIAAYENQARL